MEIFLSQHSLNRNKRNEEQIEETDLYNLAYYLLSNSNIIGERNYSTYKFKMRNYPYWVIIGKYPKQQYIVVTSYGSLKSLKKRCSSGNFGNFTWWED